ncbi:MAG: class I SAM-dependent methyltransferase [Novosphingobium sp.]
MVGMPEAIKFEDSDCPLCGKTPAAEVFSGRDLLHDLPGRFTVVRCTGCGLKRTSPRPTPDTIGFYYPSDYGAYVDPRAVTPLGTGTGLKARFLARLKRVFDTRAHAMPDLPPGRLLEVGCATGAFMKEMADAGWDVEGVEFSSEAASTARSLGFPVTTGALETIDLPAENYDLITAWMVLEHLHQPVDVLAKMRKWIRPDGRLVISVPDAGGIEFRLFKSDWYALQLPTHLFHYDPANLDRLLARCGWKVVRLQHQRTMANWIGSIGYALRSRGFDRLARLLIAFPERGGRLGALVLFPLSLLAAAFGQTGRMTIWAEPA